MSIDIHYLTGEQLNEFGAKSADALLCLIGYGAPCPDWVPMGCPFSQLEMIPLTDVVYEAWTATSKVHYDAARRFAIARTNGAMMALYEPEQMPGHSMRDVARETYGRIFDIIEGAEQRLLRAWNYMADITGRETTEDSDEGTERYRNFNAGRAEAFDAAKNAPAIPPAASALGSADGNPLVYFLAGDSLGIPIENPRQVSAYKYPEQYGPRSPSFSRATLATIDGRQMLFISGTASIVGHQSQHPGDIELQTAETIANLRAVLAEAQKQGFTYKPVHAHFKVYMRDPAHLTEVQTILAREFPGIAEILFLRADICRPELLVEIEAVCGS